MSEVDFNGLVKLLSTLGGEFCIYKRDIKAKPPTQEQLDELKVLAKALDEAGFGGWFTLSTGKATFNCGFGGVKETPKVWGQ